LVEAQWGKEIEQLFLRMEMALFDKEDTMRRPLVNILTSTLSAIASLVLLYLVLTLRWPLDLVQGSLQQLPVASAFAAQPQGAAIEVTATIGLDPHQCASTDVITVTAGVPVVYCYTIANTGDVTLTTHLISDTWLGQPIELKPYTLTPPGGMSASFYLTAAAPALQSAVNLLRWTALGDGVEVVAQDVTRVIVPAIVLTHTVGLDPHTCADANRLVARAGTLVTHCYTIANSSEVTFQLHTVLDSRIGLVQDDWPFVVEPGATVNLTATDPATMTTTSLVTWTAFVTDGLYAVATAPATIQVPALRALATFNHEPELCTGAAEITATVGTVVTYCYLAENSGGVLLMDLTVRDSVAEQEPYVLTDTLPARTSLWFYVTAPVTPVGVNTVTWTARTEEGLIVTQTTAARVNPLARVQAIAFYDADRDGTQDPLEQGVDGVKIVLASPAGVIKEATTAANGLVDFLGLDSDQYTVTVSTDELPPLYSVKAAERTQAFSITQPAIYTKTFALFRATDPDQFVFLPLVTR
jgi:hypothetical protein